VQWGYPEDIHRVDLDPLDLEISIRPEGTCVLGAKGTIKDKPSAAEEPKSGREHLCHRL
jgi:hypothetical protein